MLKLLRINKDYELTNFFIKANLVRIYIATPVLLFILYFSFFCNFDGFCIISLIVFCIFISGLFANIKLLKLLRQYFINPDIISQPKSKKCILHASRASLLNIGIEMSRRNLFVSFENVKCYNTARVKLLEAQIYLIKYTSLFCSFISTICVKLVQSFSGVLLAFFRADYLHDLLFFIFRRYNFAVLRFKGLMLDKINQGKRIIFFENIGIALINEHLKDEGRFEENLRMLRI